MSKCSVLFCPNQVKFKFPKNPVMKKKWLTAIKRIQYTPKDYNGLCKIHFASSDIVTLDMKTKGADKCTFECLRGNAVPCYFSWNQDISSLASTSNSTIKNQIEMKSNHTSKKNTQQLPSNHRAVDYELDKGDCESLFQDEPANSIAYADSQQFSDTYNETQDMLDSDDIEILAMRHKGLENYEFIQNDNKHNEPNRNFLPIQYDQQNAHKETNAKACQTEIASRYSIEQFRQDAKALSFFTGLRDYEQFMTIFYLLGPSVRSLNYVDEHLMENISLPNQLLLVLWKLKHNPCDTELAYHFGIQKMTVRNIFASFIIFMCKQWSLMEGWPSQGLIDFCSPKGYSQNHVFLLNSINHALDINQQKKKLYLHTTNKKMIEEKCIKLYDELLEHYEKIATSMEKDYMLLAKEIIGVCLMLCHFKEKLSEDSDHE
ncbi:hypothetical protein QAD02_016191 [Eretmocerus hayati]|uniref:Uncharacterized protein n=1 Tax=Eretmocerus hayati TaxID=131215 RepID=A0ACC2PCU1_9HYME|nr:hypothetical protein QAD02_016191 [Eretmocerus hayati]